jgi:CBS domain-containing protein
MKARDIMTSPVITVRPDTTVPLIAALLFDNRISAVPVVDDGVIVGIVSEADLLHRHEIGTERIVRSSSWWLRLFSADRSVAEYVKSHARIARDIMTSEVVSVAPHTPVAEIATILETRGVKRVPVLHGGRLVGIVSRSNLVQALALKKPSGAQHYRHSDYAIRKQLLAELERQSWWRSISSNVIVTEGVVHYFGTIDAEDQRQAARVAAENVSGVRAVEDHRIAISSIAWSL